MAAPTKRQKSLRYLNTMLKDLLPEHTENEGLLRLPDGRITIVKEDDQERTVELGFWLPPFIKVRGHFCTKWFRTQNGHKRYPTDDTKVWMDVCAGLINKYREGLQWTDPVNVNCKLDVMIALRSHKRVWNRGWSLGHDCDLIQQVMENNNLLINRNQIRSLSSSYKQYKQITPGSHIRLRFKKKRLEMTSQDQRFHDLVTQSRFPDYYTRTVYFRPFEE